MSMKHVPKAILATSLLLAGVQVQAGGDGPHWGYSGEAGPANWGRLSPEFSLCEMGKNQSPVNLTAALDAPLPDLQLQYGATMNEVVNNGHTIQVNSQPGSVMVLEGKEYALKQVHFHTPSENHIDGRSFPMEAHFVHADAQGNLAVVGVMFEPGLDDNSALATYWRHMPTAQGGHSALKIRQNAGDLLPASQAAYYRFNGSLTTPPCSEGVKWVVLKSPVKASETQIDRFRKVIGENNRPIQPLNARVIVD